VSRSFATVLDWLLCAIFWIGFILALPGTAIAHAAHYGGLLLAERRYGR
jgi:hypothetical protein